MNKLVRRFNDTRNALHRLALQNNRDPGSIRLLAVSKTRTADEILSLYRRGQRDFGENYLQEALQKQQRLAHGSIRWHFIGPIQSNKTRTISRYFDWVHTVDRAKIAQRLNDQRPSYLPPLCICIQVNVDHEPSKAGITIEQLPELVDHIKDLPNVRLRGLMCIPKSREQPEYQQQPFVQLHQQLQHLNNKLVTPMDTLSMGMSQDMEAAIRSGSTLVRIGTAIFGART